MATPESNPKITGGCYCGKVRFEATPPIHYQTVCHCENCRRAIGAQSVAWITVDVASFKYTKGTASIFKTDTDAERAFCSNCGSSLTYTTSKRPKHVDITTGSLDHPNEFEPTGDIFLEEKVAWVHLVKPDSQSGP